MKPPSTYCCEICGATHKGDGWFLVGEDRDADTLQILKWNSRLAEHPGMRHLCSPAHVEELVSRWMLSGSLEFRGSLPASVGGVPVPAGKDEDASYRLGELMLDRASFAALGERPDMLSSILEAIDGALQASAGAPSLLEEAEEEEDAAPVYDA